MGLKAAAFVGQGRSAGLPERVASDPRCTTARYREGRPAAGNARHYRWMMADGTERAAEFKWIYQPFATAGRDRRPATDRDRSGRMSPPI